MSVILKVTLFPEDLVSVVEALFAKKSEYESRKTSKFETDQNIFVPRTTSSIKGRVRTCSKNIWKVLQG